MPSRSSGVTAARASSEQQRTSAVRLNKYLAQAGIASRRGADELIARGEVSLNGHVVRTLGTLVQQGDSVKLRGAAIEPRSAHTYLIMHKPTGVVTTLRDPQGRRTVADILPSGLPRVAPVGRLDYDTSGLLLLTDDGDLAHRLLHPRFGVEKTYRATIAGRLLPEEVGALRSGVRLSKFRAAPCRVRVLAVGRQHSVIDLTLREGKNREVRRMLDALGHPVLALQRQHFGPISLGELRPGETRFLNTSELERLLAHSRGNR